MGYIEYKKAKNDVNGNMVWHYRFYNKDHKEFTEHFNFIGRKSTSKGVTYIISRTSPEELYNAFTKSSVFIWYSLPELSKAQKEIDF